MHLQCRDVRCDIAGRTIVSGINLEVPRGRMIALVGCNGSGKSTLIRALTGLRKPVIGTVHIDGSDLAEMPPRMRAAQIAYVGQEETPAEDLLVGEMVAMGRIPHRPPWALDHGSERELVLDALEVVGMADAIDRRCNQLSGGERRLVILARGLAQGSELLILDEPTNHLDIHHQIQLLETVRGLGKTVIAAMHDLSLAATYFDEIAILHDGRLITVGPPWIALAPDTVRRVFDVAAAHVVDPTTGHRHLVLGAGTGPSALLTKAHS